MVGLGKPVMPVFGKKLGAENGVRTTENCQNCCQHEENGGVYWAQHEEVAFVAGLHPGFPWIVF